jgi:radical SAM superfamily enzyme YgiQ (UPF0313 family)
MKVLLINPWQSDVFPSPSLGYLQASLKEAEVDVKACDLDEAMLEKDEYDLVAISFHSFSVRHAITLRNKFKSRMICGGHHPSALPEQMLSVGYDQVVVGEGERAIVDVIKGNKAQIIYGESSNLNDIPFPDYTGLSTRLDWGLPIISSRGCPFDCTFCASSNFWHRQWRMRSAENVLDEIIEGVVNKGYKNFMFEDDNFTMGKDRAIQICNGLTTIGGLSWQCASRAETLVDDELCINLKRAGCHTVWLGVESLSQDSLDRCSKRTTVEKMLTGIGTARSHGLRTLSQFIVGLPGDTRKNIEETVRNIRTYRIGNRGSNILWILPNTEAHKKAKEKGFDDSTYLNDGNLFYTFEQDIKTLQLWAHLINAA